MPTSQAGIVLRHIRKLAAAQSTSQVPDRELLQRFSDQGEGAAFEELVRRHGAMVLRVSQRLLRHWQDAEDVFQATFLTLTRKAGSIRKQASVGCWLHGVAYCLSLRVRTAAARRRAHEQRATPRLPADPADDVTLREAQALLDEELTRLPEKYRAPLVLCYLESATRDEAAQQLGWSLSTLKRRLEQGRERLRGRLARRGLTLTAGLLASTLVQRSAEAAPSAALVATTQKAALAVVAGKTAVSGLVSAEVAALVQGVTKAMLYTKLKIATVILLAAGVVITGFGLLRHQVLAANQADSKPTEAPQQNARNEGPAADSPAKHQAADSVQVRGRVLDPEGKPLAGAKLYLAYRTPKGPAYSERARSEPDGRFRFAFSKSELFKADSDDTSTQVLAAADGYGSTWVQVGPADVDLRLVKSAFLDGRIRNEDGKPVAGATVRVREITRRPPEILTRYLDQTRKGEYEGSEVFSSAKSWAGPFPGQMRQTTGSDGRFRLNGFGPDDVITLGIEGGGIHHTHIFATTRPIGTVTQPIKEVWAVRIYGARLDYLAAAARLIRGVVRDKATGMPLPGVQISSSLTTSEAQTDANGRYELPGCLKSDQYHLDVRPAEGQLFFCASVTFKDTPGLEPLAGNIELIGGVPCRGRLTDKETGKPIAGAEVHYNAIFPNAFIVRLGNQVANPCSTAKTSADGRYTIMVIPGPGVLAFTAPRAKESYVPGKVPLKELADLFGDKQFHGTQDFLPTAAGLNAMGAMGLTQYNAVVLIKPAEKEDSLTRDVALEHGVTRTGKIVGPDGQPVTGVTVVGLRERAYQGETLPGDRFILDHLSPRGTRTVLFYHKKKNLGASLDVRGDETGALTVRLQPCGAATGRVVDADGQPLANQALSLERLLEVNGRAASVLSGGYVKAKTDKDGRFRADGLVPGVWYSVRRQSADYGLNFRMFRVEPGQVKDIGEGKPYP